MGTMSSFDRRKREEEGKQQQQQQQQYSKKDDRDDNDTDINNNLEMFINLSDNQQLYQHEATCVGKIIDGFDTVQRLLETTITTRRTREGKEENGTKKKKKEDDDTDTDDTLTTNTNVSVKTITASHITNQELEQLYNH